MKLLLAVLALISAGPAAADCPKAADWARAFYSEHYFFYAGAPDPILQFTTPEFGTLLKKEWAYSKGEAQARTRVLAPSRFHHSARRIAVICVLSCAALTGPCMKQYVISLALVIAALVAFPTSHANAQSQAEMNRQAAKEFERADTELNKTYEALLRKLPDAESKEKLKQSQRAWLAFRDAEAAFAADQTRGGSMGPTIRYETMTELTQQRIKQLKSRLTE